MKGAAMERITSKIEQGHYSAPADAVAMDASGAVGAAIDRLGAFEDAVELVEEQLARTAAKLDELKAKGRIRSAQGQQLLAQKLAFANTLSLKGVSQDD